MASSSQRRGSFSVKHALSSLLSPSVSPNINTTTSHSSNKYNTKSQDLNVNTSSSQSRVAASLSTRSTDYDKLSDDTNTPTKKTNDTNINRSSEDQSSSLLNRFLLSRGFINPKKIIQNDSKDLSVSIATTGQYVFLPTISSNDDEYLMQLNGFNENNVQNDITDDLHSTDSPNNNNTTDTTVPATNTLPSESHVVSDPNNEVDSSMTPYNIAIVLSVKKQPHLLSTLHIELCSRLKLFWNNGVPPSKTFDEEFYKCISLKWDLNPSKPDFFIDTDNSVVIDNLNNNNNTDSNNIQDTNETIKRRFVTMIPNEQRCYIDKKKTRSMFFQDMVSTKKELLSPGDYIFILPCVFNNHIPETLYYPSARVNYSLKVGAVQGHPNYSLESRDPMKVENSNERLKPKTSSVVSTTNERDPIPSQGSSITLNKTELEKVQPKKLIKNKTAIFQKMKKSLHHISSSPEKGPLLHTTPPIELTKDHLFGQYPIVVVRTPPLVSVSTANKPIYINRIWTDSLSYEISFAQKYVSLNSQVPIKIKLAPLEKNICVKRIRVSVNEKITFVSKNLEYEFDQVDPLARDPYNPYYLDFQAKRRKERNLPLLEIRTREKGARALREEIIENAFSDNLISYSYITDDKNSKNNKKDTTIGITEPLTIETVLDFPKFEEFDKKKARITPPYGIDSFTMIPNPERFNNSNNNNNRNNESTRRNSVIGILTGNHHFHHYGQNQSGNNPGNSENNNSDNNSTIRSSQDNNINNKYYDQRFHQTKIKSNSGVEVKFHTRLNESKRGLYLDSMHFSNIHARHKLEIMLRISKPDPQDSSRLRHYEVLIDTPIYLVSEMCNSGNMELPTYHMATSSTDFSNNVGTVYSGDPMDTVLPPSFEEAISVPNSPVVSPIGSPNIVASYDPDNLYIQQLSLSRATSISGPYGIPQSVSMLGVNSVNNNNNTNNNISYGNGDNIDASSTNENAENHDSTNKNETQINYPNGNGIIFNNLDNVLNSSSLFKKDYNMNNDDDDDDDNGQSSPLATFKNVIDDGVSPNSDVETLSDPPDYNEAINN